MSAGTFESMLEQLRSSGARVTAPRRAVIEALVELRGHPTADDLAEYVAQRHASVHRSSVYRTLDALSDLGLVHHVHLGHGRAVYHLSDDHDVHVVCESCGALTHVPVAVFASVREAVLASTGFDIQPGHFAIPASCASCRTDKPDSTDADSTDADSTDAGSTSSGVEVE